MAISEIPAKFVESSANLTGKKMEIARDLFKMAYGEKISTMKIKEITDKYKEVYHLMEDITPPEQITATHFLKRYKKSVYLWSLFGIFLLFTVFSFWPCLKLRM